MRGFDVRRATQADLRFLKQLADSHRHELGFVLRPALARSISRKEVLVAQIGSEVIGFVEYHHRRDRQTTLYHIVVDPDHRGLGVGEALVDALRGEARESGKTFIQLKCPADLPARSFYAHVGFRSVAEDSSGNRKLITFRSDV